MTLQDLLELSVLNHRVDDMATRLFREDPLIGDLLHKAGDFLNQAGQLADLTPTDVELTACEDCGCTVEDGECVCEHNQS